MARAPWVMPMLLAVVVAGCDDDEDRIDAGGAGGSAAPSSGASAGGASAGTDAGGERTSAEGGSPNTHAGATMGGEGALPSMTLSVYNVVLNLPVAGQDPTTGQLERVELPPWFTLRANVPAGTRSVEFTVDGDVTVDDFTPFLMHTDAFGTAHWEPTVGDHVVRARAFSKEGRQGSVLASVEQTISYAETGLAPDFEPLSDVDNAAWVAQNLEQVMVAHAANSELGMLDYWLFVPPELDPSVKYPLLVFLHDRSARSSAISADAYASSLFTGKSSIVSPNLRHQFPAIVLVPQCPAQPADHEWGHWYGSTPEDPTGGLVFEEGHYPSHDEPSLVAALLHQVIEEQGYNVDPKRRYLVGEGMGGLGTWDIAWRWPELWAAAVPIAGLTDTGRAPLLVDVPFWVFHSAADTEHPVKGSLDMVDKLKLLGGIVYYTQYQDVTHAQTAARVWTGEPELLRWIWAHGFE